MKLATLRRRPDALPGVSGVARLDRRIPRLIGRLNPGDVAIIDYVDLDQVTAENLAVARPAAVVNAAPSISGRYPNLGPQLLVAKGIVLLDNVGADVFGAIKEGVKVRIDDDVLYVGETEIVTGTRQDLDTIRDLMREAKAGLASQLEAFAVNTAEFMTHERALLVDGVGIPRLRTKIHKRHVVVVVRSQDHKRELKALKQYVREFKPVLIGVDGGADALLEAGFTPHVIVGDMDAVSDAALATGAEVVVHAYRDGRAPGMARVQDLGVEAITFPTSGTSEDAALLLADEHGADLVVSVGSHAGMDEFLDRGRAGMASTFLTRLRLGSRLVDARSVTRLYRSRISGAALLLLVLAAMVAIVATVIVSDVNNIYVRGVEHGWHRTVDWIQGLFT